MHLHLTGILKNVLHFGARLGVDALKGGLTPTGVIASVVQDLIQSDFEAHAEDVANHGLVAKLDFGEHQAQAETHLKAIETELKALLALKL